ncbi:Spy/CpxP family protein refolding chaperone [uncultured Winogradskyella sp.]|uniref:Spy/CpxP family protein refolding chaperone n=1 Tax=uncultured Winogradskyella sp. TaxID=395353 RepID=UPI0030DBDAF3|tara:strand:+ start:7538 stop:7981 length:444 start_codon:yes stop_codon:yes gene_type:complete
MKKLLVIALALFTLNGVAQEKKEKSTDRHHKMELREEMTPKDIADLKTKKMTLRLDLTDAQQKKVHKLIFEQSKTNQSLRKEHKAANGEKRGKPSKDERLKMQNHKLDQLIAMKREMKTILTPEQYAKFEKMKPKKHKRKGKGGKRA